VTEQEKLIVDRLKATYADVEEMRKQFAIVSHVALVREQENLGLKILCARAADALGAGQYTAVEIADLIAELRKAAK